MSILPACMYVHHVGARCPWRPEADIRALETTVTNSCEPPCVCWKQNLSPLEEELVFLRVEPPLQLPTPFNVSSMAIKYLQALHLVLSGI